MVYELSKHWPSGTLQDVVQASLQRTSDDLNVMFKWRGVYEDSALELKTSSYSDVHEWDRKVSGNKERKVFDWYSCYEQMRESSMSNVCDTMVTIKNSGQLSGFAYYRHIPGSDVLNIVQLERLNKDNPLAGNFCYVALNIGVTMAHKLDIEDLALCAPFYWSNSVDQKVRSLGFRENEQNDLQTRVPLNAKRFSYRRFQQALPQRSETLPAGTDFTPDAMA